jgi:GAF domain-containing protein
VIWLGALLIEAHQGQTFTGEQARLCRNMADQAALVIDSHLLLKLTRQAALREQALRETIERIRDADSAEKVLHIAAEELSEVFDVPAEQLKITEGYPAPPEDKTLSTAEQELIEDVADQVALAIENIKLVEATKKRTLREQIVSDITARLQHTASVDDVLETAVRTLHTMLGDYDVTLRLAPQVRSAAHRPAPDSQDDGVVDAEAAQEARNEARNEARDEAGAQ